MKVCYAGCKGTIQNASHRAIDRSNELMEKIIKSSLRGLEVPEGESIESIERELIEDG